MKPHADERPPPRGRQEGKAVRPRHRRPPGRSSRPGRLQRAAKRAYRLLRNDRVAASHLVYFLLSAALFMPLVGGMLYFMRDVSEGQLDTAAGLEARARDVLEKVTGSGGMLHDYEWDDTTPLVCGDAEDRRDWEADCAGLRLSEVGIAEPDHHRLLAPTKISNLQQAGIARDEANAYLDYEEMHEALRLDERFDFHLRIEPIRADLSVDPFGSRPIQGTHVAYIAALVNTNRDGNGEWTNLQPQAAKEIAALEALGLWNGNSGFDAKTYYPRDCGASPSTPLKHGTVVGDTAHNVAGAGLMTTCLLGPETKAYSRWFTENYLFYPDGERRFDAVVFGTGVDLTKWQDHGGQQLRDFVGDGGTLIFLTSLNAAGFVTQCAAEPCLLHTEGTRPPMTAADDTHQLLFAPNMVAGSFTPGTSWSVCTDTDPDSATNELKGFYVVNGNWVDPCFDLTLGTTTTERYGEDGGTVILVGFDLASAAPDDVSALLANMLSYGVLQAAYLVYGEDLPDDRVIRVAHRVMAVELPNGHHQTVSVKLFLWRHA